MNESPKMTSKRILALIGAGLLVVLYLVTLGVAVFGGAGASRLLFVCLAATVLIPVLLWIYIWVYGKFTGNQNKRG